MKRRIMVLFCTLALIFAGGCGSGTEDTGKANIVATSYPVYIFTMNVLDGVDDLSLNLMIDQEISCIHDYTLTVSDMMMLERADFLIMNGAGLEEFLQDVIGAYPDLPTLDCSQDIAIMDTPDGEEDPHIWLDPDNAATMTKTIADGLSRQFPEYADIFQANCQDYCQRLAALKLDMTETLSTIPNREIITFHDGFAYFAKAFDLTISHSIEEEEGSEASASEITEIIDIIRNHGIKAVFTEINGSDSTAKTIARETGVQLGILNTIVSGEKTLSGYEDIMRTNADAVASAAKG